MLRIVENYYFNLRKLNCVINFVSKQLIICDKLYCNSTIAKKQLKKNQELLQYNAI